MPRLHKKTSERGNVSHEAMLEAIKEVLSGRSVREVAKERGISKSSLHRKSVQYKDSPHPENERFEANFKKAQKFDQHEEKLIAEYLKRCSLMFFGLSTREARQLAHETAAMNNMQMPASWKENQAAGKDWLWGFLRRNPQLSIRTPEATSIARASAFNKTNVERFFTLLKTAIEATNASGFSLYNLDETGCTTVQKQTKVIAPKGHKQIGQTTSAERGELITACCIISAAGNALPPVFIFPRKNYKGIMMHGAPEGSLGIAHPSGWMTKESFLRVIEHFITHARPTRDKQVVLIMDNHVSHVSLEALQMAKDNFIHILTLPPHTSNKTQPLDRTVFGPMKQYFNSAVNSWMMMHPGKPVNIYDMAQLIGTAWIKAATPTNIQSGFRSSGIWPFNPNIFSDNDFMPSSVTDRPEQPATPSTSAPEQLPATPSTSAPEQSATPSTSAPEQLPATPSTSAPEHLPTTPSTSAPEQLPTTPSTSAPEQSATPSTSAPEQLPATPSTSAPEQLPTTPSTSAPEQLPATPSTSAPEHLPATPSTSAPEHLPTTPSTSAPEQLPTTPSTSAPEKPATPPALAPEQTATPSALESQPPNCHFTPPEIFRGYPKAQPRKPTNRGRKRGKTMLATSTPEMKRLRAEEDARCKKTARKSKRSLFLDPESDSDMDIDFDIQSSSSDGEIEDSSINLKSVNAVSLDDFVLCEFTGKRKGRSYYYVAKVTENVDHDGDIVVQFFKRLPISNAFAPSPEDLSLFPLSNVKAILPQPKPQGTTSRTQGLLLFNVDFRDLEIK